MTNPLGLLILLAAGSVQSWTTAPSLLKSRAPGYTSDGLIPPFMALDDGDVEFAVNLGLPPLGIVFEDIGAGFPPKGVKVVGLTPGGKGESCGRIEIGDQVKVRIC